MASHRGWRRGAALYASEPNRRYRGPRGGLATYLESCCDNAYRGSIGFGDRGCPWLRYRCAHGYVRSVLSGYAAAYHISQTVPTVAIAPLLVLWLGYGIVPKVVLIVLTTFFPVAVSLVSGFRSVDADVVDLMRTMRASRRQLFWYAKLPAALDQLFSGLRISATYAIVSAVIAEWLGGMSGLGVYMTRVRKSFAYDRMFAAILVVSALSLALIAFVSLIERVSMPWKRAERNSK